MCNQCNGSYGPSFRPQGNPYYPTGVAGKQINLQYKK